MNRPVIVILVIAVLVLARMFYLATQMGGDALLYPIGILVVGGILLPRAFR